MTTDQPFSNVVDRNRVHHVQPVQNRQGPPLEQGERCSGLNMSDNGPLRMALRRIISHTAALFVMHPELSVTQVARVQAIEQAALDITSMLMEASAGKCTCRNGSMHGNETGESLSGTDCVEPPPLDEEVLRQLNPYFARPVRDKYLLELELRVVELIKWLRTGNPALQDFYYFKHDMVGICGMLGCTVLANALKEDRDQSGESDISLMEIAERTLHALQKRIGRP